MKEITPKFYYEIVRQYYDVEIGEQIVEKVIAKCEYFEDALIVLKNCQPLIEDALTFYMREINSE